MNLKTQILDDMKNAMKSKDQVRLETIRFLQSAVKNREIELRPAEISNDEILGVIKKLVKQRKESIDQFKSAGRNDLADKEMQELTVLETYLPQQMSREQVEAAVTTAIAKTGAKTMKDMGALMKEVMALTAGAADNKMVSEIVKAKLS